MPRLSRRELIGGVAMSGLVVNAAAASETTQPPFGPAPPPLDGPELPSFRFPLGDQQTHQFAGGTAKEATVVQFPVSEKLAGVYMTLEPGALRELHWHANAAEWAYVIGGRCRVTTIDPQNQCEIVDFGPGDVWYFPRGHGHSIQGLGPGTCTFVLVFDNGYFSEFGTFSISDWLGPPDVLAREFRRSGLHLHRFPQEGSLYRHGAGAAAATGRSSAGLPRLSAADASLSVAGGQAAPIRRRNHAHRVGARVSDLGDDDRRAAHHRARRLARAALASERGGVAALSQGQRTHDGVREPRPRA